MISRVWFVPALVDRGSSRHLIWACPFLDWFSRSNSIIASQMSRCIQLGDALNHHRAWLSALTCCEWRPMKARLGDSMTVEPANSQCPVQARARTRITEPAHVQEILIYAVDFQCRAELLDGTDDATRASLSSAVYRDPVAVLDSDVMEAVAADLAPERRCLVPDDLRYEVHDFFDVIARRRRETGWHGTRCQSNQFPSTRDVEICDHREPRILLSNCSRFRVESRHIRCWGSRSSVFFHIDSLCCFTTANFWKASLALVNSTF